jgi:hypothetical protein
LTVVVRTAAVALCVFTTISVRAGERPLPDLSLFLPQVKATLVRDAGVQNGYMYTERKITEKVDGAGRVVHSSEQLMEVYPGPPGHGPYRRVLEEDGHPVPTEVLAAEDRKQQRAIDTYANELTTSEGARTDAELRARERREDAETIDDVFRVYAVQLIGRETLDGEETIVATLTPKADALPRTNVGKMMRHFHGRAWVSEHENEVVRVEVEALDDVSIGWGGLFARVHKSAHAMYQRRKIDNETWLPVGMTWAGSARVLLLKQLRQRGRSQFFGYRKFSIGTSTNFPAHAP